MADCSLFCRCLSDINICITGHFGLVTATVNIAPDVSTYDGYASIVIATDFDEDYVPSDPQPMVQRPTRTQQQETEEPKEEEEQAPSSDEGSILPDFFSSIE